MMRRLCAAGAALAVLLSLGGAIAMAQPSADPVPSGSAGITRAQAVTQVLASDERFVGVEDFEQLRRLAAREMSWQPLVGSSYFRVLPTVPIEQPPEAAPEDVIRWRYPANWLIEVTLVEGCMEADFTSGPPWPDPCTWRHSWFFRVQPDGEVSVLFDEGDPAPALPPAE